MRNIGACPRCAVRIELGVGQAPSAGRCAACGQRYFVVVAEEAGESDSGSGAERVLELLALREPPPAPSLREARGLRRSAFTSLVVLAMLPLLFVVLALAAFAVPEAGLLERLGMTVFLIFGVLLVVFPLAGVLAMGLVRLFLARRPAAPARSYWHSVQVVALGGLGLGASFLLFSLAPRLPLGSVLLGAGLLATIFLGWVTTRLAPAEPYRHAFVASALYLALGTLMLLPLGLVAAVAPLVLALYVPLFLLGAWLGVRFAQDPPGAELAP